MGDRLGLPCLGTPGAVDFLANPQLPSVASMANPLGGPGRGSSLGSETHPAFILYQEYIALGCDNIIYNNILILPDIGLCRVHQKIISSNFHNLRTSLNMKCNKYTKPKPRY